MCSWAPVPARFQVLYNTKDCWMRSSIETPDLGVNLATASPQVATTRSTAQHRKGVLPSLVTST